MGGKKIDDEKQGHHQEPGQEEKKISLASDSSRYPESYAWQAAEGRPADNANAVGQRAGSRGISRKSSKVREEVTENTEKKATGSFMENMMKKEPTGYLS